MALRRWFRRVSLLPARSLAFDDQNSLPRFNNEPPFLPPVPQVDPLEPPFTERQLAEEWASLQALQAEMVTSVRESEREIRELLASRAKEENSITRRTPFYDIIRDREEGSDEEPPEEKQETQHDFLSSFVPSAAASRALTRNECLDTRTRCLAALKERLLSRAAIMQKRFDSEQEALAKRMATYQRDRDQMTREDERVSGSLPPRQQAASPAVRLLSSPPCTRRSTSASARLHASASACWRAASADMKTRRSKNTTTWTNASERTPGSLPSQRRSLRAKNRSRRHVGNELMRERKVEIAGGVRAKRHRAPILTIRRRACHHHARACVMRTAACLHASIMLHIGTTPRRRTAAERRGGTSSSSLTMMPLSHSTAAWPARRPAAHSLSCSSSRVPSRPPAEPPARRTTGQP